MNFEEFAVCLSFIFRNVELMREGALADHKLCAIFLGNLKVTKEKSYKKKNVLKADKADIYYKKPTSRRFISKKQG